ncbi:MAG: hypothetical protein WBA99_15875 [Nodosilinea sp.]
MVHQLAKSSLTWSIGGVGAIAAVLIGWSYLSTASGPAPAPELPFNERTTSPWQLGTDLGWQAAVAAQTAQTQAEWHQVSDLWSQAIAALERVPAEDPNYAQAQAKAEAYRSNRAIARNRQAQTSGAAQAATVSTLQNALASGKPAFTFVSGPANTMLGRSADGLATVELAGDRATLVLPRREPGTPLTMTQVVYANQFVALAAPEATAQPWLSKGLRAAQANQPQSVTVGDPVTVSAKPEAIAIIVVTDP